MSSEPKLTKYLKGFAALDKDRMSEIARAGGIMAHIRGAAHEFTPEEAVAAGKKGGAALAQDREYMSEIGKRGGRASGEARRARKAAREVEGQTWGDRMAVLVEAAMANPEGSYVEIAPQGDPDTTDNQDQ